MDVKKIHDTRPSKQRAEDIRVGFHVRGKLMGRLLEFIESTGWRVETEDAVAEALDKYLSCKEKRQQHIKNIKENQSDSPEKTKLIENESAKYVGVPRQPTEETGIKYTWEGKGLAYVYQNGELKASMAIAENEQKTSVFFIDSGFVESYQCVSDATFVMGEAIKRHATKAEEM